MEFKQITLPVWPVAVYRTRQLNVIRAVASPCNIRSWEVLPLEEPPDSTDKVLVRNIFDEAITIIVVTQMTFDALLLYHVSKKPSDSASELRYHISLRPMNSCARLWLSLSNVRRPLNRSNAQLECHVDVWRCPVRIQRLRCDAERRSHAEVCCCF